jgi:hypothetical protein
VKIVRAKRANNIGRSGEPAETRFYVVNTDKRNRDDLQGFMLKTRCACAAYGAKRQVKTIPPNSIVFLYENRVGIIACGIAHGDVQKKDYEGNRKELYFVRLKAFRRVAPPITAATIAAIQLERTGKGTAFRKTVQRWDDRTGSRLARIAGLGHGS